MPNTLKTYIQPAFQIRDNAGDLVSYAAGQAIPAVSGDDTRVLLHLPASGAIRGLRLLQDSADDQQVGAEFGFYLLEAAAPGGDGVGVIGGDLLYLAAGPLTVTAGNPFVDNDLEICYSTAIAAGETRGQAPSMLVLWLRPDATDASISGSISESLSGSLIAVADTHWYLSITVEAPAKV